MIAVLFAAALTSAASKPLLVPPPGFHFLARDPVVAARLARGNGEFLGEYRRSVRVADGRLLLSESVVITLSKGNGFGLDPQGFAAMMRSSLQRRAAIGVFEDKAVKLCNGTPGWILAFKDPSPYPGRTVNLYAGGNGSLYIASLRYMANAGDLGAARALTTFCPPLPRVAQAQARDTFPFSPPPAWSRTSAVPQDVPAPYRAVARWLHPAKRSGAFEALDLIQGPALADGESAQQQSEAMLQYAQAAAPNFALKQSRPQTMCGGEPGWFSAYTVGSGSRTYRIERIAAFGNSAFYLSYAHSEQDPPDPAAERALRSLCAPQPAAASASSSPSASPQP